MTSEALKAAVTLKRQDAISVRVINMPTIKPLDEELVVKAAKECGAVVTCEEHSILGGLGEAVAAVLGEQCPVPYAAWASRTCSATPARMGTVGAVRPAFRRHHRRCKGAGVR